MTEIRDGRIPLPKPELGDGLALLKTRAIASASRPALGASPRVPRRPKSGAHVCCPMTNPLFTRLNIHPVDKSSAWLTYTEDTLSLGTMTRKLQNYGLESLNGLFNPVV